MSNPLDCDVLIAGAGPTGMSAAIALHDFGFKVILIDRHETGLGFSRAILVNSSALRALKPFGIHTKIEQAGVPFTSMAIRGPHGDIVSGAVGDAAPDGIRPISLPQLETEHCLNQGLSERGITVERPQTLVSFQQDGSHVASVVEGPKGPRTLTSRYLLGADGAHSKVRETLQIDPHRTPEPLGMYSQDAILNWEGEPDLVIWILDSGAVMAMRIGKDRVRFAATTRSTFEELGLSSRIQKTTWESDFDVYFAQVDTYGVDRVWIAGDAAHIHSPIGGRGMNMGIADGIRFAEAVRDGDFEGYAADRHRVSGPWVRKNQRFTTLVSDPSFKGHAFRALIRAGYRSASLALGGKAAQKIFAAMTQG
ncbi:MAG: Pentachlorophenol 4-monooxygenase [Pseudomonadota bacterium]|jgi:2-polyprenyl-6-methoxyphenol hydroxylase-like FAD-dependent oxidoreductase